MLNHTLTIHGATLEDVKRGALDEADRIEARGDSVVRVRVSKDEPAGFAVQINWIQGDAAA